MPQHRSDPDSFIRHHVAQPVVDRLELDPSSAARSIHRLSVTGGVLGTGALMATILPLLREFHQPLWISPAMGLALAANMAMLARQLALPQAYLLNPLMGFQRLLWTVMTAFMIVILFLLQDDAGRLFPLSWIICILSMAAGVCAVYVNVCRKPPKRPRRDRKGIVPAGA